MCWRNKDKDFFILLTTLTKVFSILIFSRIIQDSCDIDRISVFFNLTCINSSKVFQKKKKSHFCRKIIENSFLSNYLKNLNNIVQLELFNKVNYQVVSTVQFKNATTKKNVHFSAERFENSIKYNI